MLTWPCNDPGFKQAVRKVSYTGVTLTRDNLYLTPDGSYSIPHRSCRRAEVMDMTRTSPGPPPHQPWTPTSPALALYGR